MGKLLPHILCSAYLIACASCSGQNTAGNDGNTGETGQEKPQSDQDTSNPNETKTGSTARFTVLGDRLYAVSGGGIAAFDVTTEANPAKVGFSAVSGDIETFYNDGEHLFIGSQNALFIYSVDDIDKPEQLGMLNHARACDPVITESNVAFVTLRSGFPGCIGGENQLKIIDISNREEPAEISTHPMTGPVGLGMAPGNRLFVCDGPRGLIEIDIGDLKSLIETSVTSEEVCQDIIATNEVLLVTGEMGITQYDLTIPALNRLSRIEIGKNPNADEN